jgi:hypothetical protein
MRTEVLVLGIRKERGKLPAPTTPGPLTLVASPAAGGPIWGEPVNAALSGAATGAELPEPVFTGWAQPKSSVITTANPTIAGALPLLRFLSTDTTRLGQIDLGS